MNKATTIAKIGRSIKKCERRIKDPQESGRFFEKKRRKKLLLR
jgi:hypothetical protein